MKYLAIAFVVIAGFFEDAVLIWMFAGFAAYFGFRAGKVQRVDDCIESMLQAKELNK